MRGIASDYQMVKASTVAAASQILSSEPNAFPFAGGTDLMVLFEAGTLPKGIYVSIDNIEELREIRVSKHAFYLGALTTYSDILQNPIMVKEFPNVVEAARVTGALAIQNRGTLGGNIANGSPAADTPPALLSYDAEIHLGSNERTRTIPYAEFHLGYKKSQLQKGELILGVELSRTFKKHIHYYRKVGARKMQAISKVVIACTAEVEKNHVKSLRIAYGSVAPMPVRAKAVESLITGQSLTPSLITEAIETLPTDIHPISDIRSTENYRLVVAQNCLRQFLEDKCSG